MQLDVRAVIHFLYLRQKADEEIYDRSVIAYRRAVVCPRAVRNWVKAFAAGRTDLNDLPKLRLDA
jgi:hypothetical protein